MIFIAGTALAALTAVFVMTPLFREPKGNLEVELLAETELDRLLNRKAVIYSNLKDLEFEYKMGRLGDADYQRLESGLKAEAAEILHNLDQLGIETNLDETIEQAIAERKTRLVQGRKQGREAAVCPGCGADILAGKPFCPDCGRRV